MKHSFCCDGAASIELIAKVEEMCKIKFQFDYKAA